MKRAWLIALLASSPVLAQEADAVYRWTDAAGELHYTNDPQTIPPRYRARAKKTEGQEVGTLTTDQPTRGPGSSDEEESLRQQSRDQEEQRWRGEFQQAHGEIARLEAEIAKDREVVQNTPPQNTGTGLWQAPEAREAELRIAENQTLLQEARGHLEALERRAREDAVPFEWRR